MMKQDDFTRLIDRLKTDRDELKLKMHLAGMEVKEEFEEAEKKWNQLKSRAMSIAGDAAEASDEYVAKAKVIGDELKEAYRRIADRLNK